MSNKYRQNLSIGFGLSILLLIATSVASYQSIQAFISNNKLVDHTNKVNLYIERAMSDLKDMETGQRGFLLTGEQQFLDPVGPAEKDIALSLDSVTELTVDNPAQQKDLERLREAIHKKVDYLKSSILIRKNGMLPTTELMIIGKSYMDKVREIVRVMHEREIQLLEGRREKLQKTVYAVNITLAVGTLLSILITVLFYNRVRRDHLLQLALLARIEKRDKETQEGIERVQDFASKINEGDFSARI